MPDILLKCELHTSRADLEEAKSLVLEGPDTLIVEGKDPSVDRFEVAEAWFALSIYAFFWILESVYASDEIVVDLAKAQGIDVVYTRDSDMDLLDRVPFWVKAAAAGAFYLLLPASIWVGFLTGNQLMGAYLLFLGIITPLFIVRSYEVRSRQNDQEEDIAKEIRHAVSRGHRVLVIVGAGHIDAIRQELPEDVTAEVYPPKYGIWSIDHLRDVGLPMFKAGLVVFSVYLLGVWTTVQVVNSITSLI